MSTQRVKDAVLAKAQADAKALLDKTRQEAESLLAREREQNEMALAQARQDAEARVARDTARELGRARHEGRLQVLQAKNEVLDKAFERAAALLAEMPEKDFMALMAQWLKAVPANSGGALHVRPDDAARFSESFLNEVNASRPEGGRFSQVVPDPAVKAGFILEGESFTADFTLERRLAELRASAAGELAKELFAK